METQTRLSRHNKFISVENLTIFSVSSDDYLHVSLSSQSSQRTVTPHLLLCDEREACKKSRRRI